MKWKNKGHEYDVVYENIKIKSEYYLFGAGDYGIQFERISRKELCIVGYIDNAKDKQGRLINGYKCFSLNEIYLKDNQGIIVTMSQVARVEPILQLEEYGYTINKDFFILEEFWAIYQLYKNDKVYFSSISFLPSTACNLKCKHCLNFNPYTKHFFTRNLDKLKDDIDLFFSCVDRIMLFHVSGGEPFIYEGLIDLVEFIDEYYGNRIDTLRTVTNGTVMPSEEFLKRLSKVSIEVTVDDYRDSVPQYKDNYDTIIKKFKEYGIKYSLNKAEYWIDLAPKETDYSSMNESWLMEHRDACNQSWQELRDGKLFSCNYASYAQVAGLTTEFEEFYDLTKHKSENNSVLVEFRLGYTDLGYTNFCKYCRGFTENNIGREKPAAQL